MTTATEKYRLQIDDMAARLRVETAAMLTKTTEHAAIALVGKQTAVLQDAATNAVIKSNSGRARKQIAEVFCNSCNRVGHY